MEVPIRGGTLTEGVVGNPRFINPVLALSEADKNMTALVYSGLMRITPSGEIENDLAENIEVSEDHLTYTATLSQNASFHDGAPVTADDVIFTISKILDPIIKSPRRGSWDGVEVAKVDEQTVTFTLKKAYAPFVYNLTTGIIPKHIWKNVSDDEFTFSQFNTLPVGSGPYEVKNVERNSGGIPDYYELTPYLGGPSPSPYIKNLVFHFYPNEEALIEAYNNNDIDSLSGVSPDKLAELDIKSAQVIDSPLPRIFAVFFNQSKSKVLLNKEIRQALDLAAPKEEIVQDVLQGYGTAINGPLPAGSYLTSDIGGTMSNQADRLAEAQSLLEEAGWKKNEETGVLEKKSKDGTMTLSFSLSTGDAPELRLVAEKLIAAWKELGAEVSLSTFETGDLNQNVIRPRQFDALLFGEVVGRDADLYPFWHSSQRNDPGLNITLYVNNRADKLLEDARSASDPEVIEKNYLAFLDELKNDIPAVFLYTPSFLYVVPESVQAVTLGALSVPQDRFLGVRDWYIETDNVWKIFLPN